jgi:nitrate reductase delta subunit
LRRRRAAPPYKLLSLLLRYPDQHLVEAREEIREAIEQLPRSPARRALERFCAHLDSHDALELEAVYVESFDLRRRTGLYLTYYLHGDTRKRGMALLGLKHLYRRAVLEFASLAPPEVGERLLRGHRPALELLRGGLEQDGSPYAPLVEALCLSLPRLTPLERQRIRALAEAGPPTEQVGLEPFAPPEVVPGSRL